MTVTGYAKDDSMSTTKTAMFTGLVLGVVAVFGGFYGFLLVLVCGAVGLLVGLLLEGKLNLGVLTGRSSTRI